MVEDEGFDEEDFAPPVDEPVDEDSVLPDDPLSDDLSDPLSDDLSDPWSDAGLLEDPASAVLLARLSVR